jgi:hypothetical protein
MTSHRHGHLRRLLFCVQTMSLRIIFAWMKPQCAAHANSVTSFPFDPTIYAPLQLQSLVSTKTKLQIYEPCAHLELQAQKSIRMLHISEPLSCEKLRIHQVVVDCKYLASTTPLRWLAGWRLWALAEKGGVLSISGLYTFLHRLQCALGASRRSFAHSLDGFCSLDPIFVAYVSFSEGLGF